jgi:hypothetical protein
MEVEVGVYHATQKNQARQKAGLFERRQSAPGIVLIRYPSFKFRLVDSAKDRSVLITFRQQANSFWNASMRT